MNVKSRCLVVAGLVASIVAWGAAAAASTITYTLGGVGSGIAAFGGGTLPFSDVPFEIKVYGDTSMAITVPFHGDHIVPFYAATLFAGGQAFVLDVDPSLTHIAVFDPTISAAFFGDIEASNNFETTAAVGAANFSTYDGVSKIGPILGVSVVFFSDIDVKNGPQIFFDQVKDTYFSAVVPEPADWMLMIVGAFGVGYVLRTRKTQLRAAHA